MENKIFLNDLHDLGTETPSEIETGTQNLERLYILGYDVPCQKQFWETITHQKSYTLPSIPRQLGNLNVNNQKLTY